MANKPKSAFKKIFLNLILLLPNLINFGCNITSLISLEARLAGRSLGMILMLSFLFAALLISTWICILALLFSYFLYLQWSAPFSLFILLIINVVLMTIVGIIIAKHKKNLSFPETRYQCARLLNKLDRS